MSLYMQVDGLASFLAPLLDWDPERRPSPGVLLDFDSGGFLAAVSAGAQTLERP